MSAMPTARKDLPIDMRHYGLRRASVAKLRLGETNSTLTALAAACSSARGPRHFRSCHLVGAPASNEYANCFAGRACDQPTENPTPMFAQAPPVALPVDMRTKLNIGSGYGLLLVHVESNGPAATAGLMLGDIVVEIGGKSLPHTHDLRIVLGGERVGEQVPIGIVRSGERKETSVTLGDRFGR